MDNKPFFLVGCVRSGTTLMRDMLREHPRLCSPEETHFFRWGDPFGTEMFLKYYLEIPNDLEGREPVYKLHRNMDGVTEEEFIALAEQSDTRADFMNRYCDLFMRRKHYVGRRWFDKSPQNIYGILMLNAFFDRPRFIHLVRDPLDVVASMKVGEVIRAPIKGACNYWLEATTTFEGFKRASGGNCLEIRFEDFIARPEEVMRKVLSFLREDPDLIRFDFNTVRRHWRDYREALDDQEVAMVRRICGAAMARYGY